MNISKSYVCLAEKYKEFYLFLKICLATRVRMINNSNKTTINWVRQCANLHRLSLLSIIETFLGASTDKKTETQKYK